MEPKNKPEEIPSLAQTFADFFGSNEEQDDRAEEACRRVLEPDYPKRTTVPLAPMSEWEAMGSETGE